RISGQFALECSRTGGRREGVARPPLGWSDRACPALTGDYKSLATGSCSGTSCRADWALPQGAIKCCSAIVLRRKEVPDHEGFHPDPADDYPSVPGRCDLDRCRVCACAERCRGPTGGGLQLLAES